MKEDEGLPEVLEEVARSVEPVIYDALSENASPEFQEVLLYPVKVGGKRIRPAVLMLSCEAAGGNPEDALNAAAAIELIHNYTLIIDDIIDHGEVRRGMPTLWRKYGLTMALLAAVQYREVVSELLLKSRNSSRLLSIVDRYVMRLVEGERLDVLFEQVGREDDPYVVEHRRMSVGFDDYVDMVVRKTSSLYEASAMMGAVEAGADENIVEAFRGFGLNLGISFQIVDDLLDLFGSTVETGKQVGKDILEHKLGNMLILRGLERMDGESKRFFMSVLRSKQVSQEDLDEALSILARTGVRENAVKEAWLFSEKAKSMLSMLPDSKAKRLLFELADYVVYRNR
ncbi:MAG: polyprenyl synthetase family protein [Candidatus Brockarchaeota archaeon]|nr:polyprenyl synthetase family protein [Candidatus Brockarchaeota archaeon]MBO3809288.1 polyprenyl synthetase family protein [Candidatus Brockarchaeota archaeon]